MRFPQTIEHRGHKAKIYGRRPGGDYYRVAFRAGGKRVLRSYPDYQSAKVEAEKAVRDLWQGSQAGALSRVETTEAVEVRRLLSGNRLCSVPTKTLKTPMLAAG